MRAPINARKHYVQTTLVTNDTAGSITQEIIVSGVAALSVNLPEEVTEGSLVKAIYFEYWVASNDASASTTVMTIQKYSNSPVMTYAQSIALDTYGNKKNVFFVSQGITGDNEHPLPLVRGWIKIPKGKQRIGLNDKIRISFSNISSTLSYCGFATFKSYA